MSRRSRPDAPVPYEVRVGGHLDERWAAWFGGVTLTHEDDGTTALRGDVADQAQLHGLIAKVRDLGATLISVRALDALDGTASRPQQQPLTADADDPNP